jgi:hypothetical protein
VTGSRATSIALADLIARFEAHKDSLHDPDFHDRFNDLSDELVELAANYATKE